MPIQRHYHVEMTNVPPIMYEALITTDKKLANARYNEIVKHLRDDLKLEVKFNGSSVTSFSSGGLVTQFFCEKNDCLDKV